MKIIIADDQKLLRDCLKHMIEQHSDIEVAACASDGEEAVELCRKHKPDMILMDIMMPNCDGIEATRRIKEKDKMTKVLILTTSTDNESVETAIKYGADGYILKNIGTEELILSIKSVNAGLDIIHKDVYKAATKSNQVDSGQRKSVVSVKVNDVNVRLTERELQVIKYIVDGNSINEMASNLYLTEGRVRNIITEIISKLMLKDRAQLVAFSIKNNLV